MDDLTPRQQALFDYIHIYMINTGGRPPTYREILRDRVGKFTKAGAFTSQSVIHYNLQRLDDHGRLICNSDGTARNIRVPNSAFAVPWNQIHGIPLENYPTRVVGVDWYSGQFSDEAKQIFYSWWLQTDVSVYTFSLKKYATNLWDDIGYTGAHEEFDFAYQVFTNLTFSYGIPVNEIAVITVDHFERAAAIGFGMAVYNSDEVFNVT